MGLVGPMGPPGVFTNPTVLSYYEEYTFTTVFALSSNSASVDVNVTRVGRIVTVYIPTVVITITDAVLDNPITTNSSTAIPARFFPPFNIYTPIQVTTNNPSQAYVIGLSILSNTGYFTISPGVQGTVFIGSSGTIGWNVFSMTWSV